MQATDVPIPWASIGPLVGVFGWWLGGLLIYAVRVGVKGRFQSRRVEQIGGTRLLNSWTMEYGYWMVAGFVRLLIWLKISPNLLTLSSLLLSVAAAAVLLLGWFGLGGWLMITAALFDLFDGMVARETGKACEAGEYLDAVVDRYSELVCLIAVLGYYSSDRPIIAGVVGLAMIASIMITYNRTKGEAQGVTDLPGGLMRRHERALYIGVGIAASPIPALWLEPGAARPVFHLAVLAFGLVALLGNISAVRLAVAVHRRLRGRPGHPTVHKDA